MQWLHVVSSSIGMLLVLGVTGCSSSESTPQPTTVATPVATPTWEELKAQSRTIGYCVPDALRGVADNDFAALGLPFCGD